MIKTYEDRTAHDPHDGAAWLLLGLFEAQRGRDAAAVAALRRAEQERKDDALPAYYLAQALVMIGQPDAAALALERALERHPTRNDLLEIFQALGRVHQRAHRNDQALAVWARLEKLFPDDARVQEQIASALAEEAQLEPALTRYEALAKTSRDPYRRAQFRLEAADLKVRLGRQAEALRDLEGLLGSLDPESWLAREVRRRVEDVFLRNDDQAGLAAYYERWLKAAPDDVEAMARLGRTLAAQGRASEARTWLDRAVKLAPSRTDLGLALIDQLIHERKFAEATPQYEAISRSDPNNPDVVRDWGRLLLRDTARPEAERKQAATAVWNRLLESRPRDPAIAAQVADLFRQAGFSAEAIALYEKAVALAPESPQYREYLGEYYHALKRSDEALAAWRAIAAGPNRNAKNLTRLAEVLTGYGYKDEAIAAVAEACRLDPRFVRACGSSTPTCCSVSAHRFDEADVAARRPPSRWPTAMRTSARRCSTARSPPTRRAAGWRSGSSRSRRKSPPGARVTPPHGGDWPAATRQRGSSPRQSRRWKRPSRWTTRRSARGSPPHGCTRRGDGSPTRRRWTASWPRSTAARGPRT